MPGELQVLKENLTIEQYNAVLDNSEHILCLACAGSGKSRTLAYKIAYLISQGELPESIIAFTFTEKAADSIKRRVAEALNKMGLPENYIGAMFIGTLDSFCQKLLGDIDASYRQFDVLDLNGLILFIMSRGHKLGIMHGTGYFNRIKEFANAWQTANNENIFLEDIRVSDPQLGEKLENLEKTLRSDGYMDFSYAIRLATEELKKIKDRGDTGLEKYKYLFVDEYQDINPIQEEFIKTLAGFLNMLFVVGDDDQSIYGWRGAEIKNILNFDKEFPDAKVYKMVENYRSTPEILEAANKLIHYNTERHEKSLVPIRKDGAEVTYFTAYNDLQEADWVIDKIRFLMARYGYRKSDFAILVRATSLTRLFESALAKIGMKYRVLGGIRFYDRKEILDTLAYMRLISNNADNEALERIINVPQRGIGEASVQKIRDFASERGISMFDAVLSPELPEQLKKKVQPFAALIGDLLSNSFIKLGDFVEYLIEKVGFERYYTSTGSEEEAARWDNVKEFLSEVKQFEEKLPDATLNDFLQTVTLVRDDEDDDPDRDKITVATMHAVKGLEFAVVFTVGLEEGTFPSAQALKADEKSMEEERRVMYVAITRARDRLFITNAGRRFKFNHTEPCLPSRFVDESRGVKNDSYMTMKMRTDYISGFSAKPSFLSDRRLPKPVIPAKPAKPAVQKDLTGFVKGAEVTHPRYGDGIIFSVSGSGKDATASISFKDLGIKKFVLQLAPITLKK